MPHHIMESAVASYIGRERSQKPYFPSIMHVNFDFFVRQWSCDDSVAVIEDRVVERSGDSVA